MKGYITNNKCYIFPQEAGQIPEVEASVFYVQQEDYVAWIEENESLADKISPYNYNVMTVNPKVWANHENDDLEPAQKEDPELAWSDESATAQIGETNTFPTLTNPHSVTVSYSSSDGEKATIDASTGEITLVAEGDTTISAVFAGDDTYEAQTVTYTLTVQAAKLSPELVWSAESATVQIGETNTFPTLTNPHNVLVHYVCLTPDVATIDETTGEITLVGEGTTDIYASYRADDEYADLYYSQNVSYSLTVEAAQTPDPNE